MTSTPAPSGQVGPELQRLATRQYAHCINTDQTNRFCYVTVIAETAEGHASRGR
jgi:hypothetical protein